jgi:GDP-4-dehydro-6-deoxy-D-mannose reductase
VRALITGIEGFAGRHLARELQGRGFEVWGGYYLKDRLEELDPYVLRECDLTRGEEALALLKDSKPQRIYHLAGQSSSAVSFKDPVGTFQANVIGTIHLLEGVRRACPEAKVLLVTSCEVYGAADPEYLPTNEKAPFKPLSPYAASKASQDYLGYQYFKSYQLEIIRVRPFPHVGPGQGPAFALPGFAKQIAVIEAKGVPSSILVGNLDAERDLSDVRDIVQAYAMILEQGVPGEAYNVGSGRVYSIRKALEILLSKARVETITQQDESRMRPADVPLLFSDCTKLKRTIRWEPEIPLEKSLEDLLDSWRKMTNEKGKGNDRGG